MAVLPRGSCLKGRAILELCVPETRVATCRLSDGERGQSGEPFLICARIRGTSLRSCVQRSQGLATACSGCSGLGQHQSAATRGTDRSCVSLATQPSMAGKEARLRAAAGSGNL